MQVADLFVQAGLFQQVTSFLIDVLKEDKAEQSALQTRLLEITLASCPPHITEGIFANNLISHYDKAKIAQLCERKQLYARVRLLCVCFVFFLLLFQVLHMFVLRGDDVSGFGELR